MNILPKKRWHVRTKDNIARVRRDEAAAAEEERKRQDKLDLAESEARINFLRRQSGLPERKTDAATTSAQSTSSSNQGDVVGVDIFSDYKTHIRTTNKDLEKEQKEEQEKYEKQIGYLTYLGQDTNEALKVRSWYEVAPKRIRLEEDNDSKYTEKQLKQKLSLDPLTLINALIPPEKKADLPAKKGKARTPSPVPVVKSSKSKKHKKDKKHNKKHRREKTSSRRESMDTAKQNKREKLERLRKERLRREAAERLRAEALFTPSMSSESAVGSLATAASTPAPTPRIVQKYNSQFNPEIAKQNMV